MPATLHAAATADKMDAPPGSSAARRRRFHRQAPTLSAAAWRQFMQVARPYWTGDQRRTAWSMLALLVVLMLLDTQLAVLLNDRVGEMTSALAGRERGRFWDAVRSCLWVLAFAVPVYGFYYYMRDAFSNRWRRWLTGRFLDGYLDKRRYYTLQAEGDIDNPDQRISEDINTFTGRSANFLLMFLGSAMQLVAFSTVLWSISRLLVVFLAVYCILGTVVALWVFGAPLIRLNFWQLRREADFRFGLMRLRENAESIAFYRGEAQERAQLDSRFEPVFHNYARLIKKQRSLNLFQRGFSQLTLVVPAVILADGVLSGELEVGVAVQAAGAFAAVLLAVSVIVDNFESLSRFVAGIGRLHALSEQVLPSADEAVTAPAVVPFHVANLARPPDPLVAGTRRRPAEPPSAQAMVETKPDAEALVEAIRHEHGEQLAVQGLTLYTPQFGRLLVRELDLALAPGEGLLITGASGCGKSSLLRALAGLWRTGSGLVQQLPPEQVFFLPQRPYMQHGSLRSQLIYPAEATELDDERLLEILREVRLEELATRVGSLDATHDWEKLLSMGEQQRLAFARVLVSGPRLVILDEATSALDSANEAALYQRLHGSGATLVSIAHRAAVLRYHARVLELQGGGAWALHAAGDYRFEG